MKKKMDHLKNFLSARGEDTSLSSCCENSKSPVYTFSERDVVPTYYTCPMHTQIHQLGPGPCPLCGMSLESEDTFGILNNISELKDMTQRFWIACIFSLPLVILTMSLHFVPIRWTEFLSSKWVELALSTPVVIWCGEPFFKHAWISLKNHSLNMFTLIGMGVGIGYFYSLFITIFQSRLECYWEVTLPLDVYFEPAAVIITFVLLGQIFELKARTKTSFAIRKLLQLSPKTARIVRNNDIEEDIPLSSVQIGDILKVRPGEKIPVDGVILEGHSFIDESMVTGESFPLSKSEKDSVITGTLNGLGSFLMKTERIGEDTLLAQIVNMVSKAQRTRIPLQRLADTISGYFIPVVILIALISGLIWGMWGPEPKLGYALLSSLSILIIACPCALGLAIPMSIMVGVGRAALDGILIKNAEVFENLEKIDTLLLDKTGTLTIGKPKLISVISTSKSVDRSKLLSFAASLEKNSKHPLSKAILEEANLEEIPFLSVRNFQEIPGKGIRGHIQNKEIYLGNSEMIQFLNIDLSDFKDKINHEQQKGHTIIFLAIGKTLGGFMSISDVLKKNIADVIPTLENEGLNIIMLTGDNAETAHTIAEEAGIKTIKSNVLPDQKYDFILALQKEGKKVAMIGDGINDAPALAQADVGISMGNGADIAIESSDITLISGDLRGIIKAKRLSQATLLNMRQNLFLAFIYNGLTIPIAAGILYPFWGLLLTPQIASIVMALSSASVILNATRLSNISLERKKKSLPIRFWYNGH